MRGQLAIGVAGLALGGLAGVLLGRGPLAAAPNPRLAAAAAAEEGGIAPNGPCRNDREALKKARKERDVLRTLLDAQIAEHEGERIVWPRDVGPGLSPAQFEPAFKGIVAACGAATVELVTVECSEPPCLGVVRSAEPLLDYQHLVTDCPQWSQPYGTSVQMASGVVECGEGKTEHYLMLGASPDDILGEPLDAADRDNRARRFDTRVAELKSKWRCGH